MLEDRLLIWKLKSGNADALCRIYEKYQDDMLSIAINLLNDVGDAEDTVHDVFATFARSADNFRLTGSLKSYLATSVANRLRNISKQKHQQNVQLDKAELINSHSDGPMRLAMSAEEKQQVSNALTQLPYEQREVIILHLAENMKFRTIADSQDVSINTIQSRYRYGLNKLRTLLNSEVKK